MTPEAVFKGALSILGLSTIAALLVYPEVHHETCAMQVRERHWTCRVTLEEHALDVDGLNLDKIVKRVPATKCRKT